MCEHALSPHEPVCYCGESVPIDSRHIRGKLMHNYSCLVCNAVVDEQYHFDPWTARDRFETLVRREEKS